MFLNCHSYYSLRYGIFSIDELIDQAALYGIRELVLTDINNTMGIPEFIKKANQKGIKPIAGCEFRNGDQLLYVAVARNREGLREINELLTQHNLSKTPYPNLAPDFSNVELVYPYGAIEPQQLKSHEYIGIRPEQVNKLVASAYEKHLNKLVVLHPVCFKDKTNWFLHKALRAVDHNILFSQLEENQHAMPHEQFVNPERLANAFERYPEIVQNTKLLIEICSIEMDFTTIKNKKIYTQTPEDDKKLLEKLAFEGMNYRYGTNNEEAKKRIRHELEIIHKLGFSSYFLITWDIISYSMSRGFYHVGRGSGANSIVAYCLKITDVDPIKLDLYFERFLNPRRTSPPDFDIDFSWKDRDDVQDYIFKRYGKDHTALLGATSTFKDRSIYREFGKVFGLPKEEIDLLVHSPEDAMVKNDITMLISTLAKQVVDFPNQRTIHAGGILISEEPIAYYTALDLPPKGFLTTQWDMYLAEELGFEKLDILSQRGIGHIKEAVDIVFQNRKIKIDVHQVEQFCNDKIVKAQLKKGETIGCFYIESPGMRGLLKKLHCDNYITLVAASSIIRPGVAKSGMMREYIQRFHHPEKIKYLHPVMKEQLEETFGVMVYQEDVLKVAHHFAGLDLDEADILRRAMSGKFRSKTEFKRIEEKFFSNCKQKGYPDSITQEVWRQIESFAGYSFSKAHSASYAVESFQSLFLKAYFPQEFMVAVINNFGGFYCSWVYFNEAQRCGAKVELPCINHSFNVTSIEEKTIYMGFVHVQNLERTTIEKILSERIQQGHFTSLAEFMERVAVSKEQLTILIRLGAFRMFNSNKAQLLWEAHLMLAKSPVVSETKSMFKVPQKQYALPQLEESPISYAYDEIELLGFPICMNAFDLLETNFRGEIKAKELMNNVGRKVRMLGRLVTIKYVPTVRKEVMNFGTFIDVDGEFFDSVHFPPSLKSFPFRGNGIYLIYGKVVEEFGFPSLEVEKMAKMPFKPNPQA
jgi:DNA polymerase-3 subunit alpha